MPSRLNALDQALDIAGSLTQLSNMTLADEPNFLGRALAGQTGTAASVSAFGGGIATISGLTGMTAQSVGGFLTISGAASAGNNGTFLIVTFNSATSVDVANAGGVSPDANDGTIAWTERLPYSLEDDLNFERTDRAAIKGVAYSAAIPVYQRPDAVGTNVPANLANIAGKTTDAKALVNSRKFENVTVALADGYVTVTDTGALKHADAVNRLGVPIWDGADAGNWTATYVEIASQTERELTARGGLADGYRIFGRTRAGTSGVSPNSVEIEFRAVERGADISTSIAYSWDGYQPTSIDVYYPYRERVDTMSETALRTLLVNGLISDSSSGANVLQVIGVNEADTSLAGYLTNTTQYFPFYNLPDATPSVIEALNTLNTQIGNRDYTGTILTDGYTITQSLQELANAIADSNYVRTVERVVSDINANTPHTIPGAQSYTLDGTNNGQNMWIFTRGLLRDPGPVSGGNDYQETSTTSVTFYSKIRAGDHINYVIYK